ncbi:AGAP004061-PA-like protein [Anopheles sinensis]|uniref:AGAP004061-PA-like protein n=1 Tax=Anopheles sinensis TaxID=74873 RepID=A0A084VES8_ANOSI|nr:AGAP004061-PA-like protein [Anopheles sinensis]
MFPANEPVNDELLRKIRECATVSIVYEEDQNSMICIKCIVDVEEFYRFKERCIQNDLLFHQMRQDNCPPSLDDEEDEFDPIVAPEVHLMESKTALRPAERFPESFLGEVKLTRVGYNYRVVRVNDERDVLVFRKHRYCRMEENSDCNNWECIAKKATGCPAKLMISSTVSFPLAICNRRVKHNHSVAIVQPVGTIQPYSEEIVKMLQKYTLAVDSQQRLRLLAGGYRYRMRQTLFADGMSLWVCERSTSDRCPGSVMLSYQDEKAFMEGEKHNHDVEENVPVPATVNSALMAQKKPTEVAQYPYGYNFKITDDCLLFRGNHFKPGKPCSSKSSVVWNCTQEGCTVKARVRRKIATLVNRDHEHPPAISRKQNPTVQETLHRGVNYRLILDETGHIKLLHRKHRFTLETLRKNGTTEWTCTWRQQGCKATLSMVPDEQVVYGCDDKDHSHRIGNALEQYFQTEILPSSLSTEEKVLWSYQDYDLLWNSNNKPIVRRENYRFYARNALTNGTIRWKCTSSVRTYCDAFITMDKDGTITNESLLHDHQRLRKPAVTKILPSQNRGIDGKPPFGAIFDSPGPVHLVAGGFNYRRMMNVQLNVEIIVYCAHKYLVDDAPHTYRCILRDEPEGCPGKIVLTNNALCAELIVPHNHSSRDIRRIAQPDRSSQVTIDGPNYKLIYSMTGRNCLIMHEGYTFRVYKLLEPMQSSRWRCIQGEAGCKAYLTVPLSLTKPASTNGHPHDHSMMVGSGQLDSDDTTISQELCSVEVKVEEPSENEMSTETEVKNIPLALQYPRLFAVKREISDDSVNDANARTCFNNGHLYVRYSAEQAAGETPEWICAFHWTFGCGASVNEVPAHNHDRFAAVRTNDRFSMLKALIGRGIIEQRGQMTLMPHLQTVSEYELLPSNGNLSLSIDAHRYYFYKAKNNGDWVWRCVRHRWQGCKIGVTVSHCFGKYYFQPYGTTEHTHSDHHTAMA